MKRGKKSSIDFVLANRILQPYVYEVLMHDSDGISTGSDHNPITIGLNVGLIPDEKPKKRRKKGWVCLNRLWKNSLLFLQTSG